MVTVRLKELETGEEERNYSLILISSPSGQTKKLNHPYTDWLLWSEGKFVFFLALFVPNLLKTNLLWSQVRLKQSTEHSFHGHENLHLCKFVLAYLFLKTTQGRMLTSDIAVYFPHLIWNRLVKNVDCTASRLPDWTGKQFGKVGKILTDSTFPDQ